MLIGFMLIDFERVQNQIALVTKWSMTSDAQFNMIATLRDRSVPGFYLLITSLGSSVYL